MATSEFFHDDSGCVRFWVQVDDALIGATVSRDALHYAYSPMATGEDPMVTFRAHLATLEDAVRRRVAKGSIEPVMLRESDLRGAPESGR